MDYMLNQESCPLVLTNVKYLYIGNFPYNILNIIEQMTKSQFLWNLLFSEEEKYSKLLSQV